MYTFTTNRRAYNDLIHLCIIAFFLLLSREEHTPYTPSSHDSYTRMLIRSLVYHHRPPRTLLGLIMGPSFSFVTPAFPSFTDMLSFHAGVLSYMDC
ncbi:hypothetical protein HETIRDRAFT_327789 [Heterobasidion irregulare TC 32-1]|uniref:Uncharacterized protein n=1 Tax=Heterobasidion irregulare (strain TC 32-1) TaxID=747525 RepID=W4JUU5_HETIT|nr:uncharacterized protein HETIRDRAFT_327789 [Heterobasidion irregulare TC 32-1]ETW77318.1 hypothetical protein HETIRDRAFT_327789 [Heterobasidion irregulare TC 32-1]